MNDPVAITQKSGIADPQQRDQECVTEGTATSTIDSVVESICVDATNDPLSYLLRSDTSRDGE
jgi:hypothetical protein